MATTTVRAGGRAAVIRVYRTAAVRQRLVARALARRAADADAAGLGESARAFRLGRTLALARAARIVDAAFRRYALSPAASAPTAARGIGRAVYNGEF